MAVAIPFVIAAVATYQQHEGAQVAKADARANRKVGYEIADANETRVRASGAQRLGEQRAAAAESGFDPNSGSLADVQGESAGNAELDALTTRYQGQLTAWRAQQEINNAKAASSFGTTALSFVGNAAGAYFGGVQGATIGTQLTSSGSNGASSAQSAYGQLLNSRASYG